MKTVKAVYFIGIGGIGMSALARYFHSLGTFTAGYDKTPSAITDQLLSEGINIHFDDAVDMIPEKILKLEKENVLIIFTPAVPRDHSELKYFRNNKYSILKRSEVLGKITDNYKTACVAGTHGKTSVSTIMAHIFKYAGLNMNAFLGGISKNYNSNLILSDDIHSAEYAVTEADEFDRSFLQLHPFSAVITAVDEDHLDIYEDINDLRNTFETFIDQINKTGHLIIKKNLDLNNTKYPENVFTYSLNEKADYYPTNIHSDTYSSCFDLVTPNNTIKDLVIHIPGDVNIENATAAAAMADVYEIDHSLIREALNSWSGVKRRFEYIIHTAHLIYIDDYAHHPEEVKSLVNSVKKIYKDKKITGVFQPHLYSRTRDFADEFAKSLSLLDELILLDIYPAREKPIEGVSSKLIFDKVTTDNKLLINKDQLLQNIRIKDSEILLTIGAGDIDMFFEPIRKLILDI